MFWEALFNVTITALVVAGASVRGPEPSPEPELTVILPLLTEVPPDHVLPEADPLNTSVPLPCDFTSPPVPVTGPETVNVLPAPLLAMLAVVERTIAPGQVNPEFKLNKAAAPVRVAALPNPLRYKVVAEVE